MAQNFIQPLYKRFSDLPKNGFGIDWPVAIFLTASHLAAVTLGIWLIISAPSNWTLAAFIWALCHAFIGSLSTTAYTHRLIAHNAAKKVSNSVHWFFCAFGQIFAVQGSVRTWSANHVIHHGVDRHGKHNLDPYSATWFEDPIRNLLWSHMLTFYFKHPESEEFSKAFASKNHPVIVWQDKYFGLLVGFWIFLLPATIGAYFGGVNGFFALLGGSMIGTVLAQHNTWTVNSITHMWGFTRGLKSSAVNNYFWLGPLGEGNHHGDHHDYPRDYRNGFGLSGWLLDPTRYVILSLRGLGLVKGLNRASREEEAEIIAKRKLVNIKEKGFLAQKASSFTPDTAALFAQLENKVLELKQEWIEAVQNFESLKAESKLLKQASQRKDDISRDLAEELRQAKLQMQQKKEAFMSAVKSFSYQSVIYT